MNKPTRYMIAIIMGLVVVALSLLTLYNMSFSSHDVTRDSSCINFLTPGGCKYVREQYRVTDFEPFNGTVLTVIPLLLLSYIIILFLLSIGRDSFSGKTVTLFILIGILLLAGSISIFFAYGNNRDGEEKFTGGLSYEEDICLKSMQRALDWGGDTKCTGDADKPLDDYWKD